MVLQHRSLALVLGLACACASPARDAAREPSSRTVRVAACQLLVSGDPDENWLAIERALVLAEAAGADIACFPETCLFGWVNPEAHERAHPVPGATSERLGELARRHDLMIAIGLAEREGERLFDSALLIDRDGKLLLRHRKVNVLRELMSPPYTAGDGASESVVDTRLGRIGLLICADTFHDASVEQMAAAAPDLLLVPYGWAAPIEQWPEHGASLHAWVAHTARSVRAPVVGVDATGTIGHGPWRGFLYGGQSVACDAHGNVLGVLADREPEVRVFEIERVTD